MTVKDLINILAELPAGADVYIGSGDDSPEAAEEALAVQYIKEYTEFETCDKAIIICA